MNCPDNCWDKCQSHNSSSSIATLSMSPIRKHTSNHPITRKKKHLSTRTLHQIQTINNPCHTKAPPFAIAPTSQRLGQHSRANCTCSLLGVWLNHVALMQDHNSVVVYEHEFFVDSDYGRLRPPQKSVQLPFSQTIRNNINNPFMRTSNIWNIKQIFGFGCFLHFIRSMWWWIYQIIKK